MLHTLGKPEYSLDPVGRIVYIQVRLQWVLGWSIYRAELLKHSERSVKVFFVVTLWSPFFG